MDRQRDRGDAGGGPAPRARDRPARARQLQRPRGGGAGHRRRSRPRDSGAAGQSRAGRGVADCGGVSAGGRPPAHHRAADRRCNRRRGPHDQGRWAGRGPVRVAGSARRRARHPVGDGPRPLRTGGKGDHGPGRSTRSPPHPSHPAARERPGGARDGIKPRSLRSRSHHAGGRARGADLGHR